MSHVYIPDITPTRLFPFLTCNDASTQNMTRTRLDGSRVLDLGNKNVAGANGGQLVHGVGNLLALNHGRDGDPAILFQAVDGGCPLARGDLGCLVEVAALDVVSAENELLCGWSTRLAIVNFSSGKKELTDDTTDSCCDEVDKVRV